MYFWLCIQKENSLFVYGIIEIIISNYFLLVINFPRCIEFLTLIGLKSVG